MTRDARSVEAAAIERLAIASLASTTESDPKAPLPPSLESCVENVYTWARRLRRAYPITGFVMELVRFDTQLMENPKISGVEYQQGELLGFELREYVLIKFNHKCVYAGADSPCDQILNLDHIVPRSSGGSNRINNLVCACHKHNEEKNNLSLDEYGRLRGKDFSHVKAQAKAPLKDAAAVNTTRLGAVQPAQKYWTAD